jgi:hypothetical protein
MMAAEATLVLEELLPIDILVARDAVATWEESGEREATFIPRLSRALDIVNQDAVNVHQAQFQAGELVVATAVGDGNISMEIHDVAGQVVDSDYAADRTPICMFMAEMEGVFTIRIVNSAPYAVVYTLERNC